MSEHKAGYKRQGQKYKSLLVWQYLLKRSDPDHPVTVEDIQVYLKKYGVEADVRSIYRDIADLNELFEKEDYFSDEDDDDVEIEERDMLNYHIGYQRKKPSGYFVETRPYTFEELRILYECVNSAKFITNKQSDNFKALIGSFGSKAEEERLATEVIVEGRSKSANKRTIFNVSVIDRAIKEKKKISFIYNRYTFENRKELTPRRKGTTYIVSPFQLLVDNGNYYLLAYGGRGEHLTTYRVDKISPNIKILPETREGAQYFDKSRVKNYTRRVFGMYSGELKRVKIRFINPLLDAVIERFGNDSDVMYIPDGDRHFSISAEVEISDQFFGWVSGFRNKAVITSPPEVVEKYKKFIADISKKYE